MRQKSTLIPALLGTTLLVSGARPVAHGEPQAGMRSTIAFSSTRHDTAVYQGNDLQRAFLAAEIYLIDGDGANPKRVTNNAFFDGFAALSPDGRRIIFDSNRLRSGDDPFNVSDLFVMNADGTGQTALVRGSSASWSPDGKAIAFHASASGKGRPIKVDPGAATTDNDIFVLDIGEFLAHRATPRNITNSPAAIDDDPDWSPQGRKIVFTSHAAGDDPITSNTAEIYVIDLAGTARPVRLTSNAEEERAPSWSPDGRRIAYCCRRGGSDLEICIMNADGSGVRQLTDNTIGDLTPSWSPDGRKIVFHRRVGERGQFQLFVIDGDGRNEKQLTFPPGLNGFPNWGEVRDRPHAPAAGESRRPTGNQKL
jgi:TolB protein